MHGKIWTFLSLVYAEWSSLVTGSFSACLVLVGIGISVTSAFGIHIPSESIVQIATWTLAAISGGRAAYIVWEREYLEKERLKEWATPKVSIGYNSEKPQCHSVSDFRNQAGNKMYDAMCFRLEITNSSKEDCYGCEAYLTEVYYAGEQPMLSPMNLIWEGISGLVRDIKVNVPAHLDVLHITKSKPGEIKIATSYWPNNQTTFFKRQGHYFLTVVVSGKNVAAIPPCKLKLNFDGNLETSTLELLQ